MYFFSIKIDTSEDFIRDKIDRLISLDEPVRDFWGNRFYSAGIHFTRNDCVISGFYLQSGEKRRRGGNPIRTCFRGKFKSRKEGIYFEGYIVPRVTEIFFLLFCFVSSIIYSRYLPAVIFVITVFLVFFIGYIKLTLDNYNDLKQIFR